MSIRVVVFDLDDTLYFEHDFVYSGFRAVSRYIEQNFNVGGFYCHAKTIFDKGERKHVFDRCLGLLDIVPTDKIVLEMLQVYRNHLPDIKMPDSSVRVLTALGQCKRLAVITDGYLQTQQNKIKALALEEKVELTVCTDQWGRAHWKPSEKSYLKVQEFFDVDGMECLYIGDNPLKDFVTARRLGWSTLRLRRNGTEHAGKEPEAGFEADFEIADLLDLLSLPEMK